MGDGWWTEYRRFVLCVGVWGWREEFHVSSEDMVLLWAPDWWWWRLVVFLLRGRIKEFGTKFMANDLKSLKVT